MIPQAHPSARLTGGVHRALQCVMQTRFGTDSRLNCGNLLSANIVRSSTRRDPSILDTQRPAASGSKLQTVGECTNVSINCVLWHLKSSQSEVQLSLATLRIAKAMSVICSGGIMQDLHGLYHEAGLGAGTVHVSNRVLQLIHRSL